MITNTPFINRPIENQEQYQAAAKTPATITLYKHTRLTITDYYLYHETTLAAKAVPMSDTCRSITILNSNLETIIVDTHEIDEKLIDSIDYCKMILNGEVIYFYVQNFNRLSPSTTAFSIVPDLISTIGLDNFSFTGIVMRRTIYNWESGTLPPLLPEPFKPSMPFNTTFVGALPEPPTTEYVPIMASSMDIIEHTITNTPGVNFSYYDYLGQASGGWENLLDLIRYITNNNYYLASVGGATNTSFTPSPAKLSTYKPVNTSNGITSVINFPSGAVQRQLPLIFPFANSGTTMQMLQKIKAMGGTDMILQPVKMSLNPAPSTVDIQTPAYNTNRGKVQNKKAAALHHQISFVSRNGSSQSMMLGDLNQKKVFLFPDNMPDGGLYIGFDTLSNPLNTQHPYNLLFLPWRKWQLNIVGNTAEYTDYYNEYKFNKAINGSGSPYDNYKKVQMLNADKVVRSKAIYETAGLVSNLVLGIGNNFLSGGSIFSSILSLIIGVLNGASLTTNFLTAGTSQKTGVNAQLTNNSIDYGWSRFESNAALSRAQYDVLAANQYEKLMPVGNKALYDDISSIGWVYETSLHDKDLVLFDEFLTTHGEATNDIVSEYKFNVQSTHSNYEYYQIGDGNIRVFNQTTSAATNFAVEAILEQGIRVWKQEPGSILVNNYT